MRRKHVVVAHRFAYPRNMSAHTALHKVEIMAQARIVLGCGSQVRDRRSARCNRRVMQRAGVLDRLRQRTVLFVLQHKHQVMHIALLQFFGP